MNIFRYESASITSESDGSGDGALSSPRTDPVAQSSSPAKENETKQSATTTTKSSSAIATAVTAFITKSFGLASQALAGLATKLRALPCWQKAYFLGHIMFLLCIGNFFVKMAMDGFTIQQPTRLILVTALFLACAFFWIGFCARKVMVGPTGPVLLNTQLIVIREFLKIGIYRIFIACSVKFNFLNLQFHEPVIYL